MVAVVLGSHKDTNPELTGMKNYFEYKREPIYLTLRVREKDEYQRKIGAILDVLFP